MLTLPRIVERESKPYVAIRERVSIPFNDIIGQTYAELFGWLGAKGIAPAGAPFIKYNLVIMPDLELEFGVPIERAADGDSRVTTGTLPAGRYASVRYWGGYENLFEVNAVLIGWAKEKGIDWDVDESPDGDRFASRLEIYETDPQQEPDQSKWETEVAIKLA